MKKEAFIEKFMTVSTKISQLRYLVAIRDAFIAMMPITMAGSIAVLLNVIFRDIPKGLGSANIAEALKPLIEINGYVYFGTIAVTALFFAFALGYNIAKSYKLSPLPAGLVSFAAFVSTIPQSLSVVTELPKALDSSTVSLLTEAGLSVSADGMKITADQWGAVAVSYAGATGLFSALIIGMLASSVYCALMRRNIVIKMPDNVPPAVNKAFAAIIPGTVAIYVVAIIGYLTFSLSGFALNDLISQYIQKPLLGLSQGLGSVILLSFLVQLFWFFGLHGHNVLAPVMDGIYGIAQNENLMAFQQTQDISQLPWTWTRGSFDAYAQMGGSGITIALIIAIFIFSKRQEHKTIAKLATPMGLFNINEPVIFGMPIVLNPLFIVPWLIVPPIAVTIAYVATMVGLIPPVFLTVPWVTPPGLFAFLATGGNIMAAIISLLNVLVAFLIWTPFVLSANKIKNDVDGEE